MTASEEEANTQGLPATLIDWSQKQAVNELYSPIGMDKWKRDYYASSIDQLLEANQMRTKKLFVALILGLGLILALCPTLSSTSGACAAEPRADVPECLTSDAWSKIQAQLCPNACRVHDDTVAACPFMLAPLLTSQAVKLTASDGAAGDQFGTVAIAGNTIVVGAHGDDVGANENQGSVYIFERNQGGPDAWGQTAHITASDGAGYDYFGKAVAIAGDTIVVGAHYHDVGGNETQGAAYVFERNQGGANAWGQAAYLTASDGEADDWFGGAVAIAGDTIVVGADDDDGGGYLDRGSAYVFERNHGGANAWGQIAHLIASPAGGFEYFGRAVAIADDTIVVGAPKHDVGYLDNGAAYVFERNQGGADAWGQVTYLTASDRAARDYFGTRVAIAGDTIVVGAHNHDFGGNENQGAAYVFERNQGGADQWGQIKKLSAGDGAASDYFGSPVAIAGDTVVVGAYGDDIGASENQGSAYVFGRNYGGANTWGQVTHLTASDGAAGDQFGSVAIAGDTVVVGAHYHNIGGNETQGAAYIFKVEVSNIYLPLVLRQFP